MSFTVESFSIPKGQLLLPKFSWQGLLQEVVGHEAMVGGPPGPKGLGPRTLGPSGEEEVFQI